MSVEEIMKMSESEKLAYLETQKTDEPKLCNAFDDSCESCT